MIHKCCPHDPCDCQPMIDDEGNLVGWKSPIRHWQEGDLKKLMEEHPIPPPSGITRCWDEGRTVATSNAWWNSSILRINKRDFKREYPAGENDE